MRVKTALYLIIIMSNLGIAQNDHNANFESGAFGGPVFIFGSLNGKNAFLAGGRGGWIINHKFVIGGKGMGLITDVPEKTSNTSAGQTPGNIKTGYGGITLEYLSSLNSSLHLSYGLLLGIGGIDYDDDVIVSGNSGSDGFFVIEPSLEAEYAVTEFFRLSGGLGYRGVIGVNTHLSSASDLRGVSILLSFKFGKF